MAAEAENGEMPVPGETVSSTERRRSEFAPPLQPEASAGIDLSHGERRAALTAVKPVLKIAGPSGASGITDHRGRYRSVIRTCQEIGNLIGRYRAGAPGAFLKGRLRGQASPSAALSHGENRGAVTADKAAIDTARQAGARVVADFQRSYDSLLRACEGVADFLARYRNRPDMQVAFFEELVRGNLLSPAEARRGSQSPKVSKFKRIGRFAEILRDDRVRRRLTASYTTLYAVAQLAEVLRKDNRISELPQILEACPGPLTRNYVGGETRRMQRQRKTVQATASNAVSSPGGSAGRDTLAALLASKDRYNLVFIELDDKVRQAIAAHANPAVLRQALPLHQIIEPAAGLVISAVVRDLPMIDQVLLPALGFPNFLHVLSCAPQAARDLGNARVLVTAQRGTMKISPPADDSLPPGTDVIKMLDEAKHLFPNAARALHVFASQHAWNWARLLPEDSWIRA